MSYFRIMQMAKIGNTEYPDIGLLECLHTARVINRDFGGEIKRSGLAHVLGMSPSGGAFAARLGSMRMWGIIEGRSTLRLTDTATHAVAGGDAVTESELVSALSRNVPLFNDLHSRLQPGGADKAVMAATVQELTDAPIDDVHTKLPQIERLFTEARRYMAPINTGRVTVATEPDATEIRRTSQQSTSHTSEHMPVRETESMPTIKLSFDGGEMAMDETPDNIDLFITALVTRKRKLMQLDGNGE